MARLNPGVEEERDGSLMESLRKIDDRRHRLIDLYTDGDIDRASFRTRKDRLDDEAREIETQITNRTGTRVLAEVPGTYEELSTAWEERGVDFQRRLLEALLGRAFAAHASPTAVATHRRAAVGAAPGHD